MDVLEGESVDKSEAHASSVEATLSTSSTASSSGELASEVNYISSNYSNNEDDGQSDRTWNNEVYAVVREVSRKSPP